MIITGHFSSLYPTTTFIFSDRHTQQVTHLPVQVISDYNWLLLTACNRLLAAVIYWWCPLCRLLLATARIIATCLHIAIVMHNAIQTKTEWQWKCWIFYANTSIFSAMLFSSWRSKCIFMFGMNALRGPGIGQVGPREQHQRNVDVLFWAAAFTTSQ